MDSLVEKLRQRHKDSIKGWNGEEIFTDAADRIEELESALAETFEQVYDNPHIDALIDKVLSDVGLLVELPTKTP